MELSGFYGGGGGGGGDTDTSSLSNGEGGGLKAGGSSPYPACGRPSLPALKFHNHFPPDNLTSLHDKKDSLLMQVQELQGSVLQGVQQGLAGTVVSGVGNRLHLQQQPPHLRPTDAEERVMLYVRQESEDVYTPLHVTPPTVQGLLNAVRNAKDFLLSNITLNRHSQLDKYTRRSLVVVAVVVVEKNVEINNRGLCLINRAV